MSQAPRPQASPNFAFLARHDRFLVRASAYAELYCHSDPNTAIFKLRQFTERLCERMASRFGIEPAQKLHNLISQLSSRGIANPDVTQMLHYIREVGNEAVHEGTEDFGKAIHAIKMARKIGAWYHQTVAEPSFKLPAFVPPKPAEGTEDAQRALLDRIGQLKEELTALRDHAAGAEERAAFEEELRRAVEDEARVIRGDADAAMALAEETAQENERYQAQLTRLQADAEEESDEDRDQLYQRALAASSSANPDEDDTRYQIDLQLRQAGWRADSVHLRHARGTRPQKGQNLAIAEWPTASGPADYVLFIGLTPVAVVEAKREQRKVAGAIEQAKRYSRDIEIPGRAELVAVGGSPWSDYRIPFLFATNGRPYLRQLIEESGIWFLDARDRTNHPRALEGWYTPEGLTQLLEIDVGQSDRELAASPTDYLPLWDFQHDAVRAVEEAIAKGQREILVAMATGTGKTRTCIALLYRLIKARRFRRALFMVDRSALGVQADDAFRELRLEANKTFAEVYDVKSLRDLTPDADTRLQIATVQSLVKRVIDTDDRSPLAVDAYDCIVIDECHRGYTLDREMGEDEMVFRDQEDYISKYRRVLDHFDAVRIGLTATPALHTTEIFGSPVYQYSYRRAVIDGHLVDHEPPVSIVTKLAREGIKWDIGEEVPVYDAESRQQELFLTPDEIEIEVEGFNKKVITENFNRVVCKALAEYIDPWEAGKTLIFCADDRHADLVVRLLKEALEEHHGPIDDDAVQKITGSVDNPLQRIKKFKNEQLPSVAVTVDLLTTGIDVKAITNLVFIRRVRSRILYDQMMGRATRVCPDLYGRGEDKECFHIYDAVDLYAALKDHTEMKPVVVNPKVRFSDLVDDLLALPDGPARDGAKDQLVAKIRRKKGLIEDKKPEIFEAAAGMEVGPFLDALRDMTAEAAAKFFRGHPQVTDFLQRHIPKEGQRLFISEHEDEVLLIEHGYGKNRQKPEDYLEAFGRFIERRGNEIPALLVVTQRPRELTREQLKELKFALDTEGFAELHLQSAWRQSKNEDIAASIIGFVRQRALGEPLVPYEERVDAALKRLLASRDWVPDQRKWLERIGTQMKNEVVVDREVLNQGQFKARGGFNRINNKFFDGKLDEVLGDFHEEVWKKTA